MATTMWQRDVLSQANDVKTTLTSWDACMSKTWCKWPVIIGIVIGALIILSILTCIFRCLCCGVECCCGCLSCFNSCCPSPRRKRPLDGYQEQSPFYNPRPNPQFQPPAQYQSSPAPVYGSNAPWPRGNTAKTATFVTEHSSDKPGAVKSYNEDSLPAMPSWNQAVSRRVDHDDQDEVEMDKLDLKNTHRRSPTDHNDSTRGRLDEKETHVDGWNSVPQSPIRQGYQNTYRDDVNPHQQQQQQQQQQQYHHRNDSYAQSHLPANSRDFNDTSYVADEEQRAYSGRNQMSSPANYQSRPHMPPTDTMANSMSRGYGNSNADPNIAGPFDHRVPQQTQSPYNQSNPWNQHVRSDSWNQTHGRDDYSQPPPPLSVPSRDYNPSPTYGSGNGQTRLQMPDGPVQNHDQYTTPNNRSWNHI